MAVKKTAKPRKAATPKAGPKKARRKSEEDLIRAAVEEHGTRRIRAKRKSGKVRTFKYKEAPEQTQRDFVSVPWVPFEHEKSDFLAFKDSLPEDQQVFARRYFQMECEHPGEWEIAKIAPSLDPDNRREWVRCPRCGIVVESLPSKIKMLKAEWALYCPDGYDQFDWEEPFTKDKSMWRYIADEAEFDMVDLSLSGEEAA